MIKLKELINPELLDKSIKNPLTGRKIKVKTALTYDKKSPVYRKAKSLIKRQGDKPIVTKEKPVKLVKEPRPVNPFIQKYGHLKLNAFPPIGVNESDVKVNTDGDIHTHSVLQWKDPKSGRTVNSYTKKFMDKNAKIKWNRIKKIKDNDIAKVHAKSAKLLKNKNPLVREAGAVVSIICSTGLRPGGKLGFEDTGNRGISTLGPNNVKIDGDKITLNFVGKSYQENNAEFHDKDLAMFLTKRIEERKDKEFLFDITPSQLNSVFHKIAKKGMKVKDLRTYTATKMARNILLDNDSPPPPFPKNKPDTKKMVKEKLKQVFEKVSQKLNNTPAMAKSSYVHPAIIKDWMERVNVKPVLVATENIEIEKPKYIYEQSGSIESMESQMNKEDLENCDEYPLPKWWNDPNIELEEDK